MYFSNFSVYSATIALRLLFKKKSHGLCSVIVVIFSLLVMMSGFLVTKQYCHLYLFLVLHLFFSLGHMLGTSQLEVCILLSLCPSYAPYFLIQEWGQLFVTK